MHAQAFSFGLSPSESLFYGGDEHDQMHDWLPMVADADSIDKVCPLLLSRPNTTDRPGNAHNRQRRWCVAELNRSCKT